MPQLGTIYPDRMSVPVDLAALRGAIADQGPVTYLVTVNEDGTAHIVTVVLHYEDDQPVVGAGRRTAANIERNPEVTLLWPPGPDPAYSLIVDATVTSVADDEATLEPHSAVLHRVAGADGEGPNCIPVTGD
jgi:hypothetical protein